LIKGNHLYLVAVMTMYVIHFCRFLNYLQDTQYTDWQKVKLLGFMNNDGLMHSLTARV